MSPPARRTVQVFRASRPRVAATAFALLAVACSSDGGTKGPDHSAPSALAITAGNGQVGSPGSPLATPLAARVTNAQGNPLVGKAVTFAVTRGLGSMASPTVTTDNSGIAQTLWTLGSGAVRQEATVTIGALTQTATATADTTRSLFLLALRDTVSVGDTIWINVIAATTALPSETRGAVQETITTSSATAASIVSVLYTSGEFIDINQPGAAVLNFITSGPTNSAARQLYMRTGYVARPLGAGKDVQFTHAATTFLGARTFNDLLTRVSVVGTTVHIR